MSVLRSSLLLFAALLPAAAASAQSAPPAPFWYGREAAATAVPIATADARGREARTRGRKDRADDRGEPRRTWYALPYGVTVWAGEFPYARPVGADGYVVPASSPRSDAPPSGGSAAAPCATSSGPATAASSIAAAPGAFRSGC